MILLYIRSVLGEVFRSIRYQKLKLHSVKGENWMCVRGGFSQSRSHIHKNTHCYPCGVLNPNTGSYSYCTILELQMYVCAYV